MCRIEIKTSVMKKLQKKKLPAEKNIKLIDNSKSNADNSAQSVLNLYYWLIFMQANKGL